MRCNLLYCIYGKITIYQRYMLIFMLHMALFNAYNLRVVYNLAITEMVEEKNTTGLVDECPQYEYEPVKSENKVSWKNEMESLSLYSFYIGYIFSHVPGGWLADKIGARPVMGYCMLVGIIVNAVFPIAVKNIGDGQISAVVLRTILGFTQGPLFPATTAFIQSWIPSDLRSVAGGIAFGGANFGTILGSVVTGLVIKATGDWGTPFYVWSAVAFVWYIIFLIWIFSKPQTHPHITDEELEYISSKIPYKEKFKVPWLEILKSLPCWALLFAQWGHNFIYFTVFTYLPMYLREILKMNIQSNAAYTAVPFLGLWIATIMVSFIADALINRNIWRPITVRKMFTTFAAIVPSAFLIVVSYVGCHRSWAIVFYTMCLICIAPFFSGMKINVNDLTHNYGGTIMAFVNGLGATAGVVGPAICGHITSDRSLESWRLVFWIVFAVEIVTVLFYDIFAKGDRQPWDFAAEDL